VSTDDPEIQGLLADLKAAGLSSPAGYTWQQFYELLQSRCAPTSPPPPVPLILAASGESDASKHRRLADQLQWASENGCLDEAIRYLRTLRTDQWNWSPPEQWNQDSY